jgi:predicted dehydrogenase
MRKVRIGIIGAGWWGVANHIPVLQSFPEVEVAGICRLGQEELRNLQARFSIPFGTETYQDLLDLENLDGVVISTPHHLHFEQAHAALERGLHVVCEKPMVLRASEAWQLAELARSKNLHFLIPLGWNYKDYAITAKQRIDLGAIGKIEYVHCHMASALRDLFSGTGAWFAETALVKPEMRTWSDATVGGGFAHGQFSHALGLLFYITGMQAAEIFAFTGTASSGADLFNSVCCRFTNGATGVLGGAGTMPPTSTYQLDIRVFGSEGMLLLDIERPRLEIRRDDGQNFSMQMDHPPGAYDCIEPLRTFVGLIRGEAVENRSSAIIGARIVELLDAMFRSAQTRQLVTIGDLNGGITNYEGSHSRITRGDYS